MMTVLAHSQGRVWHGTSLMAETRRRILTRIMTLDTEKRQMSMLEIPLPSLIPPMSREVVLMFLHEKKSVHYVFKKLQYGIIFKCAGGGEYVRRLKVCNGKSRKIMLRQISTFDLKIQKGH